MVVTRIFSVKEGNPFGPSLDSVAMAPGGVLRGGGATEYALASRGVTLQK